ncbi:RHS repeat-associated core domain protein [Bacteroidales bacterium KA00344]|nr:RHS repeat-associated core domain protein [Bacteroidales bacterium KA00344]
MNFDDYVEMFLYFNTILPPAAVRLNRVAILGLTPSLGCRAIQSHGFVSIIATRYNRAVNDNYNGMPEAAQAKAMTRAAIDGNLTELDLGGIRQTTSELALHSLAQGFKPNHDHEKMQFYYHPDHLGSSSYITNLDGEVAQHIEYVPFGEVFIDELELTRKSAAAGKANCNNTWNTPYRFNAKELDEETGMYYYGARYYEPRLSLWMSCDPLEEKYPNISSYDYCMNNPVKFIDPDGKELKLAGNRQQRIKILTYLQKLTNDKLGVRQDGTVIIMKTGVRNTNKKLTTGTGLISNIVKSDKQMTIEIGKIGSTNYETDVNSTNATNGKGTNVKVNFDISANPLIPTKNPKTGNVSDQNRPNEIGLAHEMIHGERSMKGKAIDYSIKSSYTYKDVNGKKTSQIVPQEELETVGLKGNNTHNENNIRKEQGLKQRGAY